MKTLFLKTKFVLAALLCSASVSQADTSLFLTPGFRGQSQTEAAYWETFTSPYNGANNPNGIPSGGFSLANATLKQTWATNAFLTGALNIYDPSFPTGFQLHYTTLLEIGQVVFQTRTLGNELDYNAMELIYDNGSGPVSLFATRTPITDLFGGATSYWSWDLTGLTVNSFDIEFNAAASSTSFDAAALDVAPVPEPGTMSLIAVIGAGLLWARHIRRK